MKKLLLILTILLLSCHSDDIDLTCEGEEQPDLICTEQLDLVCGCNGTSYMNPCYHREAEFKNSTSTDGRTVRCL